MNSPTHPQAENVDPKAIRRLLKANRSQIKPALKACAHCTLCAESCFLFVMHGNDPQYMPSHKFIHSVGTLYRKKGRVKRHELERIKDVVWQKCVLCTRCYCPIGIDIPRMFALARQICRSQEVYPTHD